VASSTARLGTTTDASRRSNRFVTVVMADSDSPGSRGQGDGLVTRWPGSSAERPHPSRREPGFRHDAVVQSNDEERAVQRDLVRRGYDAISRRYRGDNDTTKVEELEGSADYGLWLGELGALLRPGAKVLDLGCGAGIPATKILADSRFHWLGATRSSLFPSLLSGSARRS